MECRAGAGLFKTVSVTANCSANEIFEWRQAVVDDFAADCSIRTSLGVLCGWVRSLCGFEAFSLTVNVFALIGAYLIEGR
jgi:hypothetical protein